MLTETLMKADTVTLSAADALAFGAAALQRIGNHRQQFACIGGMGVDVERALGPHHRDRAARGGEAFLHVQRGPGLRRLRCILRAAEGDLRRLAMSMWP